MIDTDNDVFDIGSEKMMEIPIESVERTVKKHSKNIIDLIEVGDYVNGYICRYITDIDTGEEYLCNFDLNEMRWIPLEDIDIWESVVTKEQFAQAEYKIEKGE